MNNIMGFRTHLVESSTKDILSSDKVFLLIIGGSASGKNYIHGKYFSKIDLVDVDEITKELSGGDFEKARKMVSKAISIANKEVEKYFQDGKSVAQVSTGSGDKAVSNKLKKAQEAGFETALVLIDVDVKKAIKRNEKRAAQGKQGLIPDWKVEKTNQAARETFNKVKSEATYSLVIKN